MRPDEKKTQEETIITTKKNSITQTFPSMVYLPDSRSEDKTHNFVQFDAKTCSKIALAKRNCGHLFKYGS